MNPLPPNADELVSAYLDGQAAPDEVVLVESSPELMERVETMRGIADLLGAPSPPPAAQKEIHISAALDAFDALFASNATEANSLAAVPPRAAAATSADAAPQAPYSETTSLETTPPEVPLPAVNTSNGVSSLAAARERRRPRRFNTGIIAAAAAAVLLFVAVAAFSIGGGEQSLDVASTALEAEDASDSAAAADDVMEAEDAMDDDRPALSALEAPAPTAAAPQAAEASPLVEEDAVMADEEPAMDDEEALDNRGADSADEPADNQAAESDAAADSDDGGEIDAESATGATSFLMEPLQLSTGDFPDQDTLRRELEQLPLGIVAARVDSLEQGLFPSCQEAVRDFAGIDVPTLIGEVRIAGDPVEIHRIIDGDTITIVLVDPTNDCSVIPETP